VNMKAGITEVYKIPNLMNEPELMYLFEQVGNVKEKKASIVNIGTYLGASASALMAGMRENGIKGVIFLIDTFKSHNSGGPETIPFRERTDINWTPINMNDLYRYIAPFRKNIRMRINKCFSDDANLEKIKDISLLFIDADHTTHGCLLDLLKFSQKLTKNGIILLHDYKNFESVKKATKIFLDIRKDFHLVDTYRSIAKVMRR